MRILEISNESLHD
jgi:hypothetical protein